MSRILIRYRERNDLPRVCAQCGARATDRIERNFSWYPPWIGITILAGLLVYVVLAVVLTKRMMLRVPFCDDHRNHWFKRNLIIYLSALVVALAGVGAFVNNNNRGGNDALTGMLCVGAAGLALVWAILAIILQNTAIRPTEITNGSITLKGVCEEFAVAVEDEFSSRGRSRRYDDDRDDDDRPRSRRRSDDDDDDEKGGPPPLSRSGDDDDGPYRSGRPRKADDDDDDADDRIRDRRPRQY